MRRKQQRGSIRFAVAAMERATNGLPSEERNRYHDELVAEMHELGRVAAWRYAVGVAASASSMHAALTDGGPSPSRRPTVCWGAAPTRTTCGGRPTRPTASSTAPAPGAARST